MDKVYKALSDPTRRKILELLKNGDSSAGDISAQFAMTDASVSHHLSVLRNADLVLSEKKGQQVIYSLNTTVFQELIAWIQHLRMPKGKA